MSATTSQPAQAHGLAAVLRRSAEGSPAGTLAPRGRLGESGGMTAPANPDAPAALRLRIDGDALAANFRWFEDRAGVPAVPAVKADGYGLGLRAVVARLEVAGARAFAVSTWAEAMVLARPDLPVLILHGFTAECSGAARALPLARPVLNSAAQCEQWRTAFPGRSADVMVDTGMNRLGLAAGELAAANGVRLHTVHSHLACADLPDHPLTPRQLAAFRDVVAATPEASHALANSGGICWGRDYSFNAVRPGLGLYGGTPHPAAVVRPVVAPEARVIQVRSVQAGETVGYGACWTAHRDSRIAIVNIGYADGVPRALAGHLVVRAGGRSLGIAGRISMDMLAVDVTDWAVAEGDWLSLDWNLKALAAVSDVSQYRLLVGLSQRFERCWA